MTIKKPYYEHAGITIWHGDCREIMQHIHMDSVDVVITDPPYNVNKNYGLHDDNMHSDDYKNWCRSWFEMLPRPIIMTVGITNVPMWMAIEPTHKIIAWLKPNQCSRNYLGITSGFNVWEPILVYGKLPVCVAHDAFTIPIHIQAECKGHPCPKSIKAWNWLMVNCTENKSTILDPFMGSGTTLVAAKYNNRRAIGIEIEEKYCEMAARRLQLDMLPFGDF
jgi:site-specific DNA-methyltransferase (adenine-specific)